MPPVFSELSRNQQAMLDLALVCDLADARPQDHDAIRLRHRGIITHAAAAAYIREIEERVRTRRHVASRI